MNRVCLPAGCSCPAMRAKAFRCQFSQVSFFETVLVALSTCPVLVCVWSTFVPSVSEFSFSELNVIFVGFEEHSHCKQQAVAPSFASAGQLFAGRCCSVHTGRINSALQSVARKFAQGLLLQGDVFGGLWWQNKAVTASIFSAEPAILGDRSPALFLFWQHPYVSGGREVVNVQYLEQFCTDPGVVTKWTYCWGMSMVSGIYTVVK